MVFSPGDEKQLQSPPSITAAEEHFSDELRGSSIGRTEAH